MDGGSVPHRVTLVAGDGIGPEVAAAARAIVDATDVAIDWVEEAADPTAMRKAGLGLPIPSASRLARSYSGEARPRRYDEIKN